MEKQQLEPDRQWLEMQKESLKSESEILKAEKYLLEVEKQLLASGIWLSGLFLAQHKEKYKKLYLFCNSWQTFNLIQKWI